MDQINILKTIQLPESITGTIKDKFDAIDSNFNALGSSTYTAGKDGVTRTHTLKFKGVEVENKDDFEKWLTSQLGISTPDDVVNGIVNAFKNYNEDNKAWYANGSYEIYIGTDGTIKEALPILYVKDNTISYLGFEYENDSLTGKDVLILKPKKDVLGIDNDGYWVINGIKTNIKAEGVDGKDGEKGTSIEFGFVTVKPVEFSAPILKIVQYWDYSIPNNTPMSFDKDLDDNGKKDWFDKNKNRVFLFTYTYKVVIKDENGNDVKDENGNVVTTTKSQTYMGYVTKYTHDYNSNIPESEPIYGFYYSDATMYSPGAGGSGVSGLITALDNMAYDQQVDDKPRGIWFRNSESEKDISTIFMYNNDNTLNICKIDDYTKAYNTGDIKEESTKVKVNGDFECGGVTISKNATINGATINGATISNNLSVGKQINIGSTSSNGELGVYGSIKINTNNNDANILSIYNEHNGTTITPTKITSTDLKLIGDATINNTLFVGDSISNISNIAISDKSIYCDNGIYCDNIRSFSTNTNIGGIDLFGLGCDENGGVLELKNRDLPLKITRISNNGSTINGTTIIKDDLEVEKNVIIKDNLRVINDNDYAGIYTTTENSFKPEELSSLELLIGNKYIRVGDLEQNRATTITPTKITSSNLKLIGNATINGEVKCSSAEIPAINGDIVIHGTLTADSINTGESTGGSTSTTNFKDLTVTGSTNLKKIKATYSIPYYIYNYMNNGCFEYPKLIYDVLNKLEIINTSPTEPYSLNIDEKVCQTNYCNLYIKSYGTTYFYNYTNNNSIYSVSANDNNSGINRKGNLYRITGYIIIGDNSKNEIVFTAGNPVSNRDEYFYFDNGTNPNSYNTIPQMIYIDDYFAFIKNGTPSDIIITPYGIRNSIFVPHYVTSKEAVNDKPTTIYKYNLNSMTSNINGGTDNSNISIAKQSIMHTLGNDLKFKLIYNIPQKS